MLATFPQEDCIHVAEGIPKCCVVAAVYSWGAAQIFISKSASLTHSLGKMKLLQASEVEEILFSG